MDGMRFTYRQYARANAPFADKQGWTTPLGRTNRLLVGPFENGRDADSFVAALRANDIQSFRWRSDAGQLIEPLYAVGQSPQPTAEALARPAGPAAAEAAAPAPAAASHPARHWAQVAIGQDENALRFTYRQFTRRAPNAFAGKTGWFTPLNQTNRLLVGPFDSRAAAQAFLTAVREEGEIEGLLFRSSDGQEIEPLNSR